MKVEEDAGGCERRSLEEEGLVVVREGEAEELLRWNLGEDGAGSRGVAWVDDGRDGIGG